MRELTFRGFLTQYVRQLAVEETNSLYKLAAGTTFPLCRLYAEGKDFASSNKGTCTLCRI